MSEQRNDYKGSPPRAWVEVELVSADGQSERIHLLADTGNPCAVIIGQAQMKRFRRRGGPDLNTNFGTLNGGWLEVRIPALGFTAFLLGYSGDDVSAAARQSNPDFIGLAGLPLLREMEYGGDSQAFWLRK